MWSLSARKSRKTSAHPRRSAYRPQVDALEDRCLLSAGTLDPTFGNGAGYVTTSITSYSDIVRRNLIQADGKILATGAAGYGTGNNLAVVRYNLDGTLDGSFGSGGMAQASFSPHSATDMGGSVLQADGKVVLAGWSSTSSGQSVFALARFGTNGTLDGTFGNQGEVTTSFSAGTGGADGGVVVQPDGKIVAAGDNNSAFELVRYNANGTLDSGFGNGAEVVSTFAQFRSLSARFLLLQPDGNLIVVGDTNANAPNDWVLARYNADGTLDRSFGSQGVAATALGGEVAGGIGGTGAAALYPNAGTPNDGKIVVVGSDDTTGTWQLVRYNANGSLDAGFGSGGVGVTNLSGSATSVSLDANGRIVISGVASNGRHEIARFNSDATPDPTFGSGGVMATPVGTISVAIYPSTGTANDGKIVTGGVFNNGTKYNFAVARYLGDTPSFAVTGFPSPSTAGTAGIFTITAEDASGNLNPSYTGTVHFTSSDAHAVLPADYTFTAADQGVHAFSATLVTAGSQSITVTDAAASTINGSDPSIQVNAAAATQFVITGPASIRAGTSFSLTVTALDSYGNIATGYTGTVHFSDSVGGATLPGNYAFKASDSGVHTFTGLKLKTKGTNLLTVIDTVFSSIGGSLTVKVT